MRTLVAAAENPVIPESSEILSGILALGSILIPIVIVLIIIRQVVLTRRSAERAAAEAADGRTGPPKGP